MFWAETHLAVVTGTFLVLIAAVLILQQRRSPQSSVAWLMFLVMLPWVGVPLFLALGFRKQRSSYAKIRYDTLPVGAVAETAPPLADLFARFGLPEAQAGHEFTLLSDGTEAHQALMELVGRAEARIDALFYIVADDAVGRQFVEALTERARAGVAVRLILDRLGSLRHPVRALRDLKKAGGQVHYFSPFLQWPARGHFNLRNHRKMVIADGAAVFAGGRNIGADYLGPEADPARWNDLSFLLRGPAVQCFEDVFLSDWQVLDPQPLAAPLPCAPQGPGGAVAQLVPSGPDSREDALHDALVHAIHRAETRVWIATPYFLPTEMLTNALATAARRGVDVRLMLPDRSNQRVADIARGAYLREMGRVGCQVLRYQGGMLHAKMGILDDTAYLGSANFDVRSMLLNFEATLFLYDPASVSGLVQWFTTQEARCTQGIARAGLVRRLGEGVFRLGAPIL
ncbi:phospholipase D-like domain-containing protein [Phaeovulum sp. W22_SRMD_FR3]|uniref:phospholipase D-like domain-containing protein n=1 Tax=Phaeovulum sp. W22_SRMD_FR3 TaxID=3240274 RepID=UPI003F9685AC